MTLLEQRTELMKQIRTLEKEVAIIDKKLAEEHKVDYVASGGKYFIGKDNFLCVYYNYEDKTYYTKSILLNAKGKRLGYNTTKGCVLTQIEDLKARGFVEV